MTEWVVRRWARFGHDRLYAETPGGTALGYLDVATGRYHSDDHANLPLLEKAISDHFASQRAAAPPRDGGPDPGIPLADRDLSRTDDARPPTLPHATADWTDLSATRAGSAAREQAVAARAAQGRFRGWVARALDAKTDERAWRIGADGEEAVAAQVARLGPGWRVLHAVRVGDRGADIDHVLIGPPGVFTVNAKNHPNASIWVGGDTFLVNGQKVPYIRNSRHEARRAARLLTEHAGFPVHATGIIAVVGAHRGLTVKTQPEDGAVVVVPRRRIRQHLEAAPSTLSPRQIDAIFEIARRSTTWIPPE